MNITDWTAPVNALLDACVLFALLLGVAAFHWMRQR